MSLSNHRSMGPRVKPGDGCCALSMGLRDPPNSCPFILRLKSWADDSGEQNTMRIGLAALALVLVVGAAVAEDAAPQKYQNLLTPLLESGKDVLGTPLAYPEGNPDITAAIVTVPPGGETGWHEHEVPLFAYVLEGELTVDYGSKGKRTYRAGEAVLEAVGWAHNGTNTGTVPMKLVAVYMGGGGKANTVKVEAP